MSFFESHESLPQIVLERLRSKDAIKNARGATEAKTKLYGDGNAHPQE
jgi:hypothetical protein